ncbi:unnamed protein product, partial [Ectocarpus sp. 12 AP-2014]
WFPPQRSRLANGPRAPISGLPTAPYALCVFPVLRRNFEQRDFGDAHGGRRRSEGDRPRGTLRGRFCRRGSDPDVPEIVQRTECPRGEVAREERLTPFVHGLAVSTFRPMFYRCPPPTGCSL